MPRIYRPAIITDGGGVAVALFLLRVAVVAGLAKGLEWARPEQHFIAIVLLDVVHHAGRYYFVPSEMART